MGGYSTNFETDGFEDYELVYLGKGTATDCEGINVKESWLWLGDQPARRMVDQLPCLSGLSAWRCCPDIAVQANGWRNRRVCAECTGYRRS